VLAVRDAAVVRAAEVVADAAEVAEVVAAVAEATVKQKNQGHKEKSCIQNAGLFFMETDIKDNQRSI
jgi:hypothetical protein